MSLSAIISENISIGAISISSSNTITDSGLINESVSLTAGDAGTLSTRSGNDTGTLTLGTGHGISTGQKINIYWTGGRRYNVTVGTVNVNAVPISGGAGDNLPTEASSITASLVTTINLDVIANDISILAAHSEYAGDVTFFDVNDAVLHNVQLSANYAYIWNENNGYANPMADDTIAYVQAATSSSSASAFKLGLLYDSES